MLRKLLVAGAAAALFAPGVYAEGGYREEHILKATKETVHWCVSAPTSPSTLVWTTGASPRRTVARQDSRAQVSSVRNRLDEACQSPCALQSISLCDSDMSADSGVSQ